MSDHLAVLEELDLIESVLKGYPASMASGDALRAAASVRAAIALMRGQSWQLIETAPVGEDILVYRHGAITPYRVAMLCRGGDDEFWVDAAEKRLHVLPTRWQPLPAPPKDTADEQ